MKHPHLLFIIFFFFQFNNLHANIGLKLYQESDNSFNTPMSYTSYGTPTSNKASHMLAYFGGSVPSGAQIIIKGEFDVDVNLIWENVDVAFGENAKVTLSNNKRLSIIKGSHLFACDKMWIGIEVNHKSESVIVLDSKIEHAYSAINSTYGGNFEVGNSVLNRNYTHISVANYKGIHPAKIYNSEFTCDNNLGKPEYLRAPLSNSYTLYGILVMDVTEFNVGINLLNNTSGNFFRYADTHLFGISSSFNVKNTSFGKMLSCKAEPIQHDQETNFFGGVAIRMYAPCWEDSLSLNVGGSTADEGCLFTGNICSSSTIQNIENAGVVTSDNVDVSARMCDFRYLKYGIIINPPNSLANRGNEKILNNNFYSAIDSCKVYVQVSYSQAK